VVKIFKIIFWKGISTMATYEERIGLMSKVMYAAADTFDRDMNELKRLNSEKLFEIGYIHGFNCGNNIYDAAEEKITSLGKRTKVPQKDGTAVSSSGRDNAHEEFNKGKISNKEMDCRTLYINAYQQGFNKVWKDVPEEAMNEKMYDLINYYI
jgi:hypothetical protein